MYFKFENKKAALDFCLEVNKGENIIVSEENVTTGYAQPFELSGQFYVIADDVTKKYTDKEAIDLFAPIDTTPPPPTYMGIEIPDKFLWVFPDKAVLSRRTQLSAVQSLLAANKSEADFAPTGPR